MVAAGCVNLRDHPPNYPVKFDGEPPEYVVVRRSVPHNRTWANVPEMVESFRAAGYEKVTLLVTTRDGEALEQSQVRNNHVKNVQGAREHIKKAYTIIFSGAFAAKIPFILVQYQSLQRDGYRKWLAEQLELPRFLLGRFEDGDAKYF
jgi:hypothetical protein